MATLPNPCNHSGVFTHVKISPNTATAKKEQKNKNKKKANKTLKVFVLPVWRHYSVLVNIFHVKTIYQPEYPL